jgi:hypothetical protein
LQQNSWLSEVRTVAAGSVDDDDSDKWWLSPGQQLAASN